MQIATETRGRVRRGRAWLSCWGPSTICEYSMAPGAWATFLSEWSWQSIYFAITVKMALDFVGILFFPAAFHLWGDKDVLGRQSELQAPSHYAHTSRLVFDFWILSHSVCSQQLEVVTSPGSNRVPSKKPASYKSLYKCWGEMERTLWWETGHDLNSLLLKVSNIHVDIPR